MNQKLPIIPETHHVYEPEQAFGKNRRIGRRLW